MSKMTQYTRRNNFNIQFTNIVKHATYKINRSIDREKQNINGHNITLTTTQVQEAIKQRKNNNSQGPNKLNIRNLQHIGYYDNLINRPMTTTGLLTPHKHTGPAVKVREISTYCKST